MVSKQISFRFTLLFKNTQSAKGPLFLVFRFVLTIVFLSSFDSGFAQNGSTKVIYIVRGKIKEAQTGEPVIGANVYVSALKIRATSNTVGEYFIRLPEGNHVLQLSSVGYETLEINLNLESDTILVHTFQQKLSSLDEVVVTGDADHVTSLRLGQNTLDLATIKKIPPLLGEADIIRSLLLMPGVSTVGEGATGFNVRGGGVDQNLILLDDAPIFNTSHLFGFLTAFNSNAVLNADLYKGGIPANYGGRVASVLDIKLKQGNRLQWKGSAGIGLMAANLTVEGPIVRDRTTLLASVRSSYSDWILGMVPDDNVANSMASFYDGTLKLSHQINPNHFITFTAYGSRDSFKFPGDTTYTWGTQNFSLKLGSTLSPKIFLITTVVSSQYAYSVLGREQTNSFDWQAGIDYQSVKADASYTINQKSKSDFGGGIERYRVNLGSLTPIGNSNINAFASAKENASIGFLYYSYQYDVNEKLLLRLGMRLSTYTLSGPGEINQYEDGQPRSDSTFIGTRNYSKREKIKSYYGFEPRFSLRYSISGTASIKAGYDQTIQYLNLISNTSAVSPIDLWKLSDPYIKPQTGKQFSLGYFKSLKNSRYDFSMEMFYKILDNIIDYKDGAELLLNDRLEADLLQGVGRAYGTEMQIEKKRGKFTGWAAYTLSRTERKIKGETKEETINKGEYYPANYDKLHNLSITGSYQKSPQVSLGFNFVLSSGRPITYPSSSYSYGGLRVVNFEYRNNERSPAYHRLDVSLEIKSKVIPARKWKSSLIISIYNVYARKNPYSIFFRSNYGTVAQPYRLAVIGTAIPSISYLINF